jgi:excisionase family DNA binding protein
MQENGSRCRRPESAGSRPIRGRTNSASVGGTGIASASPPGPPLPLLTVDEVSAYLRVPAQTIYKWRTRGDGPPGYKYGKYVRYRTEDVREWLEGRRDQRNAKQ